MTTSNKFKRCARELQKVRNCSYTEALEELRELPQGTSLRDYVERVREQLYVESPRSGDLPRGDR
jgi:hypothetical protein